MQKFKYLLGFLASTSAYYAKFKYLIAAFLLSLHADWHMGRKKSFWFPRANSEGRACGKESGEQ